MLFSSYEMKYVSTLIAHVRRKNKEMQTYRKRDTAYAVEVNGSSL